MCISIPTWAILPPNLFEDKAPKTAANFIDLVKKGFL